MSLESASPWEGNSLKYLPWVAIVVAVLLVATYKWSFHSLPFGENPAAFGGFGDYIGGLLNPLISLFTLFVAVSVWKLQKIELKETRVLLREQGKTSELQRREQRFFYFLNIYRSTLESIEVSSANGSISLRRKRAFSALTSDHGLNPFRDIAQLFAVGPWENWFATDKIHLAKDNWNSSSAFLDHYFRVVFAVLRDAEDLLGEDRWRYVKLLRAQLSRDEVNLLAMNLLFDEEGRKMRPLVDLYGLLKHMPQNTLRKIAEQELSPKSFGRNWVFGTKLTAST